MVDGAYPLFAGFVVFSRVRNIVLDNSKHALAIQFKPVDARLSNRCIDWDVHLPNRLAINKISNAEASREGWEFGFGSDIDQRALAGLFVVHPLLLGSAPLLLL